MSSFTRNPTLGKNESMLTTGPRALESIWTAFREWVWASRASLRNRAMPPLSMSPLSSMAFVSILAGWWCNKCFLKRLHEWLLLLLLLPLLLLLKHFIKARQITCSCWYKYEETTEGDAGQRKPELPCKTLQQSVESMLAPSRRSGPSCCPRRGPDLLPRGTCHKPQFGSHWPRKR